MPCLGKKERAKGLGFLCPAHTQDLLYEKSSLGSRLGFKRKNAFQLTTLEKQTRGRESPTLCLQVDESSHTEELTFQVQGNFLLRVQPAWRVHWARLRPPSLLGTSHLSLTLGHQLPCSLSRTHGFITEVLKVYRRWST